MNGHIKQWGITAYFIFEWGEFNTLREKSIFKVNFDKNVKDYKFTDGITAIIYYFYEMVLLYLFALLIFRTNSYKNLTIYLASNLNIINPQFFKFIFYIPIALLEIVPVFILIKIRKENIKSVGLKADKTLKSIFLGIIFSIPFIAPSIINGMSKGKNIMNLSNLIWLFLYFLIEIAFAEEISFRGFIQTRIQGLIKGKWLSIIVVGIMFGLMHIPFQMVKADMALLEFIINDSIHLVTTCIIHIYLVYLYTRDNNIVSATVAHTLMDFIPSMFI